MLLVMGHNYPYTDLDSVVGSVVMAELLNRKGFKAKPVIINPNGIKKSTQVLVDKIGGFSLPELADIKEIEENNLVLVDHNNPLESYGMFRINKVPVLCIDHHPDTGADIVVKIIKRVGSTCTILTHMISQQELEISDSMARALVYAIACDTKALKSSKKCQADEDMIEYLYSANNIDKSLKTILEDVTIKDNISMTPSQICSNQLKEYRNGELGIAQFRVADDCYQQKLSEIISAGWQTEYSVFALMILRQHSDETEVYIFDKKGRFPLKTCYDMLISRSQDLVPYIMDKI